jgi:release factor glutamine methyltransferase
MTIGEVLKIYGNIETDLLLAHVLKKSKEFLYLHPKKELTKAQLSAFTKLAKQRQTGMPIAYLIGFKNFYGLPFKVTQDVLIPRPESEWLVDQALKKIKAGSIVLDIGTGSGCLAISIRKNVHYKDVHVWASDISVKALRIAKINAKNHKAKVKFCQSDLLASIPTRLDVIIANLPYVPPKDYKKLKVALRYEPKLALVGSQDLYKRLFSQVHQHLRPQGLILLEIDPSDRQYLKKYVKAFLTHRKIIFHKDLHGLWRYATIGPIK